MNSVAEELMKRMADAVLYTDGAREFLVNKVWDTWTTKQQQEFADAVHAAAMAKVPDIVTSRLSSYNRNNSVAAVLDKQINAVLASEGHLDAIKKAARDTVETVVATLPVVVTDALSRVAQQAVQDASHRINAVEITNAVRNAIGRAFKA